MHNTAESILVGLSGGVDSAVAALRLQQAGRAVAGVFMKNWEEDDRDGYCAAAEDLASARAVAAHLGIPLRAVNFSSEYWDRVFRRFLDEYRAGRTPNPDVFCNSEIKFRAFLDFALAQGATAIATGHYARLQRLADGRLALLKGRDAAKDQSYFLHRLDQQQLAHSRFPLGELDKGEVRRLARAAGLPNHGRKDSTGICFIGERRFRAFLARYIDRTPGDIVSVEGEVLGRHQGLSFYTIGQRTGLGIGGRPQARQAPWYVAAKDPEGNRLLVAQGADHPALHARGLRMTEIHWIASEPPARPDGLAARIRYRQPDQACRLDGLDGDQAEVWFERPQRAIAPGQACVIYQGERCLGGGIIQAALGTHI